MFAATFFGKTLDIKIRILQKYFTVNPGSIGIASVIDGRGRHTPPNKTADWKLNLIRKHIESFPTMESHYCRADSTRLYLDAKLKMNTCCILTANRKGCKVLLHDGFRYCRCSQSNTKYHWTCTDTVVEHVCTVWTDVQSPQQSALAQTQ